MKKIIFLLAVATALMTSCAKEEQTIRPKVLNFIINTASTKTFLQYDESTKIYTPKWANQDELAMFLDDGYSKLQPDAKLINSAPDGDKARFEGSLTAASEGYFYSFCPYSGFESGNTASEITFKLNDEQNPVKGSFDPACDLLVAKRCSYIADEQTVVIDDLYFARLTSILKINLNSGKAKGEKLVSLSIESDRKIAGSFEVDLANAEIGDITNGVKTISASFPENELSLGTDAAFLTLIPGTIPAGDKLTIRAETENYSINKTITLTGAMGLESGKISVLNLTIQDSECTPNKSFQLCKTAGAFEDNGKYLFAIKDGKNDDYYFISNSGSSSNLVKNGLTVTNGCVLQADDKYIFTAVSSDGGFNFKNSNGNYIWATNNTTLDTDSPSSAKWTPTFLTASGCYKIQVASGRYFAYATATQAKAYANSNFVDQIAKSSAIAQYAGAVSVFKYGGKIDPPTNPISVSPSYATLGAKAGASAKITLTAPNAWTSNTSDDWYISPASGEAGTFDIYITAKRANSGTTELTLETLVFTDQTTAKTAQATISQSAGGSAPSTTLCAGWIELPNTPTGSNFYTQALKVNGVRNYSYAYDKTLYAAMWAAYPLHKSHTSGSASSSWKFNPNIPQEYQVHVTSHSYSSAYGAGLYSRGHQVPNADRKCNSSMNSHTYYVTNQTPQIQEGFNGTIWSVLEGAVRNVANSWNDTIYVVTGPTYQKVGGSEKITYLTKDGATPKSVPVPNYYWKAVLKVKRTNGKISSAMAIGFWLEHKKYNGTSYAEYCVSVDQIEAWTGFDLYANLPASIAASAEANSSLSDFSSWK